jgi:hypothetical protein
MQRQASYQFQASPLNWTAISITNRKHEREAVEMIELRKRALERRMGETPRGVGVSPGSHFMFMLWLP